MYIKVFYRVIINQKDLNERKSLLKLVIDFNIGKTELLRY